MNTTSVWGEVYFRVLIPIPGRENLPYAESVVRRVVKMLNKHTINKPPRPKNTPKRSGLVGGIHDFVLGVSLMRQKINPLIEQEPVNGALLIAGTRYRSSFANIVLALGAGLMLLRYYNSPQIVQFTWSCGDPDSGDVAGGLAVVSRWGYKLTDAYPKTMIRQLVQRGGVLYQPVGFD